MCFKNNKVIKQYKIVSSWDKYKNQLYEKHWTFSQQWNLL